MRKQNPYPSLELLSGLSVRLQALLESESFHQDVLNLLKSELPYSGIQYWSIPPGVRTNAQLAAVAGGPSDLIELGQVLSPADAVLAYVFQNRSLLVLDTIPHEVRASSPIVSEKTKSLVAIPITKEPRANSELLGILVIESSTEKTFDDEELAFFKSLAEQISSVSKNRDLLLENKAFSHKLQSAIQEKTIELRRAHERILDQQKDLQKENKALKTLVESESRGQDFIGESPATREILGMVDKIAPTLATVLIQGESGTGKELIAKRIHQKSARANAPYVTVNCAALQESLLESELFGHEKGSFTGAFQTKIGLCEAADGGTLFLDEIGDLSPAIQTKLLRFLQEGEFYRIGGKKPIRVQVRILSATNRDLADEVKAGRFREDLFYRLNTITLKMPALRDRREDIPALCEYFLKHSRFGGTTHVKKFDSRVLEVFKNYSWPGNIRELQNTIERLKILAEGASIQLEDLPAGIRLPKAAPLSGDFAIGTPLDQVEKGHILRTLAYNQGNKTKTAQALGITIKTLYNKLHRYGAIESETDSTQNS